MGGHGRSSGAMRSGKPAMRKSSVQSSKITQSSARKAAEALFSKTSWGVDTVLERNGTWVVYASKKAYGDGYEAVGEVVNGKILNDEMGMGETALDFARRTGAKNVVVIGYAD